MTFGQLLLDEGARARILAVFGPGWPTLGVDDVALDALTASGSAMTRAKVRISVALFELWPAGPSELERRALDELARGVRP